MSRSPAPSVTAVVLCGGKSRRFGADKTAQPFGAGTVLDHLLDALPVDWHLVVVGVPRPTTRGVTWTREHPPGSGPLAGIEAGLAHVATELTVVIAGDMPFAAPIAVAVARALGEAPGSISAVAASPTTETPITAPSTTRPPTTTTPLTPGDARGNPLLTAYRTDQARAALPQPTADRPARALLDAVPHHLLATSATALLDVDTTTDLAAARGRLETPNA